MTAPEPHSAVCDYCGLPTSASGAGAGPTYCCYGCRFAAGITSSSTDDSDQTLGPASALGLSVFCTMNVVMLTMALWSYADSSHGRFELALREFLRYGSMLFSLPVLLLLGRPLISHVIVGVRSRVFTSDLLLATGVVAAYALSIINTLRGDGHVYFEVGCVILVLVTLGRWLEAAGRSQASTALDKLERLVPEKVRLYAPHGDLEVPRSQIVVGNHIHVLAGERIPIDGRLVRGRGVVDEQFFTGESAPAEKCTGDLLLGGSMNLDGDLIVEVTSPPDGGALGRLVAAVRAARTSKGRYQLLADIWSQWMFPIISVIAVTAFVVHGLRVDWEYGLLTALSVVLIACPCALALATPTAIWSALGMAASKGVLCRSGAALEKLAAMRAIRWDKTGTLTTGSPRVQRFLCESPADKNDLVKLATKMARSSNHLFSQAISEYADDGDDALQSLPTADFRDDFQSADTAGVQGFSDQNSLFSSDFEVTTFAGRGLQTILPSGEKVILGSLRWMEDNQLTWGTCLTASLSNPETFDKPVVAIGYGGMVRGIFLLEETVRPGAFQVVERIRKFGLDQVVLTGDRSARAQAFSKLLGLEVRAELLPEQKLAAIREAHKKFGVVAMVGDGLNDAPALAAADIGIALGCGADVSRDSADVCILSSDLTRIPWVYELSHRTVKTIRANLAWSFGYNSLGVILAASGQLHPAFAAATMVVSSLMVLGNSLRLSFDGRFGDADSIRGLNQDGSANELAQGTISTEVES